jgi:hypothetical protein
MPSKNLQPAVIGGLFIGVLSALPIINVLNVCCCAWVIAGGIVTAYLMQNASVVAITIGDGALGGLMAGIIGGVVNAVLSIPVSLLLRPFQMRMMQQFMDNARDMPEGLRFFMARGMYGGAGLAIAFISTLMLSLVVGAIFATIGGMIGAAIFSRGKPTVSTAPPPPPPPVSPIPPSPVPPPPPPSTPPPPEV